MNSVPASVAASCFTLLLVAAAAADAAGVTPPQKLHPGLRAELERRGQDQPVLAWVRFSDKGRAAKAAPSPALVTARSLQRRAKVRPAGALLDAADLPVDAGYVREVAARVRRIRHRSRWFDAVSVEATGAELTEVATLACVRAIEPLARGRRNGTEQEVLPPGPGGAPKSAPPGTHTLDYGLSFPQLSILHVPELHDRGMNARGVLVAHFDDGYALLSHSVFAALHVDARHDFVNQDGDPSAGPVESFGAHGVSTLSVLAGYAPGQLIGPAYGAQFALARTEDGASETPFEEDNWVAAAEWADSLGADIISSSLGYLDYDQPYPSWTWQDMNGDRTVITRAADRAAALGILVVNAAGNGGFNSTHNTLLAPADGDSVIAVGGVHAVTGVRYAGSSGGPTTSVPPRIKPEVMAPGTAVYIAGSGSATHFGYSAGTSFSAPLTAGVCALLLSVRPDATPMQVCEVLRLTASRAANPDNEWGWGILNADAALQRLGIASQPQSWTAMKGLYR